MHYCRSVCVAVALIRFVLHSFVHVPGPLCSPCSVYIHFNGKMCDMKLMCSAHCRWLNGCSDEWMFAWREFIHKWNRRKKKQNQKIKTVFMYKICMVYNTPYIHICWRGKWNLSTYLRLWLRTGGVVVHFGGIYFILFVYASRHPGQLTICWKVLFYCNYHVLFLCLIVWTAPRTHTHTIIEESIISIAIRNLMHIAVIRC